MSSQTRVQAPFPKPFRMEPRSRWSPTKATGCWCSRGRTAPDTYRRTMRPGCFWLIPLSRLMGRILPQPIRRISAEQRRPPQMELLQQRIRLRTTAVLQTKPAQMRLPHLIRDIQTAPQHRMQGTGTPMRLLPTTREHLIRLPRRQIRTLPQWIHQQLPAVMRRPLQRKPIPARRSAAIRTCRHSMMPTSPHRTQR